MRRNGWRYIRFRRHDGFRRCRRGVLYRAHGRRLLDKMNPIIVITPETTAATTAGPMRLLMVILMGGIMLAESDFAVG